MTDFEKVTDFHNMYRAFRRAKSGKGFKKSSARFNIGALDGVNLLIDQLKNRTYRVSGYSEFKVYEPKERVIQTSQFKDKVIQHCLCDNVLLPRMERIFIKENCAGQKGKGTLYGLDLLQEQMQTFYSRYGMEGHILKCDVTKFFYNIAHKPLKEIVHYHFGYDPGICWLCDQFIDSTEGKGLPLGNQINQGFALLYLDSMDKLIRCELGIEFYGRYMDDFYLIHQSKKYLQHCLEVIAAYLETLELTLNGKTQIFPFRHGVSYLGFHTYITPEGTPIRKVKNQNKRNAQRKFLRMAKLVAAGELPEDKLQASYGAYKNHIFHGNCYRLGQAMDAMIRKELTMYRKCELCGANLDPGELCDCRKEDAAPDGSDPEAAQMNIIINNLPNDSEKVKEENKKMGLKSWNEMRKLDISKHVKKRDGADYLPWASCLKLLYENGAEKVISETLTDERGSSLFMSEQTFTDKNGGTNRCYEVRVRVTIDNDVYTFSYPVLNGINAVRDALMNQNAVHKSQMRAFVKCVAINTGLGFDLWLDDADIENDTDDLSKHNLFSIKERLQIAYTKAFKKGMTTKEIAEKVGMTEDEVKVIFTYFDQLHRFEQKLNAL